jgi:hypothetical protein
MTGRCENKLAKEGLASRLAAALPTVIRQDRFE